MPRGCLYCCSCCCCRCCCPLVRTITVWLLLLLLFLAPFLLLPKQFFARVTPWLILVVLLMTLLLHIITAYSYCCCWRRLLLLVLRLVFIVSVRLMILSHSCPFDVPVYFIPSVEGLQFCNGTSWIALRVHRVVHQLFFRAWIVLIDYLILLTKHVQFMKIIQILPGEDEQITQTKIPLRYTPAK